ncbi:MAG TPA: class II glutamine amidotransferase [Thermoleophilaceae bacterium]|nr:class II glutamine amidotransferase [Thermoleophilaceae bacterium]
MCRVLGCVSAEPISIEHELLHAQNPLIHQSAEHDSGWGMAVYQRADSEQPSLVRFPEAAYADGEFKRATSMHGRMFNAHLRRATLGGLTLVNTHPFVLGEYSFSHNGTVIRYPKLLERGVAAPQGETDSEHLFNWLMCHYDAADPRGSLRALVQACIERSPFSGLNFLFSDGERLYAYKLGIFELHWLVRPGQTLVSSEIITPDEEWHTVQQDVLLVLDPDRPEAPHAERLVGDELLAGAQIEKFEQGQHLRGDARGRFAAERAARVAAGQSE